MIYKTSDGKNYNVTAEGKIFNGRRELKGSITPKGYIRISIGEKKKMLHRIIAEVFLGMPGPYQQVNHKNGIKNDNRIENLEWVSPSENLKHAYDKLGRKAAFEGKHLPQTIREKISRANKGMVQSEEWRIKNSISHKGKHLLGENPNAKKVHCVETGKRYNSIKELALELKVNPVCLYNAIRTEKKYKNKTYKKGE